MAKKLFVTGATGKLGRRLIQTACKQGYHVTAMVLKAAEARGFQKGVELFEADLRTISADELEEGMKGAVPVHLAAIVDFGAPAAKLWAINVEGTRKMVDAAERAKVTRFVHMSSTSIYHRPAYLPIDEKQQPTPVSGYGETKLEAEKIVQKSSLDYIIIRAPAIYGPGFEEGFRQVIELVKKEKMPIIGSGKNHIPLIHVDDVVQALLLAVENRKVRRNAFIVTSGEEYAQEETLTILAKALGAKPPTQRVSLPLAYAMVGFDAVQGVLTGRRKLLKRYVDFLVEDRVFDISKAQGVLDFRPSVSLEKGIKTALH